MNPRHKRFFEELQVLLNQHQVIIHGEVTKTRFGNGAQVEVIFKKKKEANNIIQMDFDEPPLEPNENQEAIAFNLPEDNPWTWEDEQSYSFGSAGILHPAITVKEESTHIITRPDLMYSPTEETKDEPPQAMGPHME